MKNKKTKDKKQVDRMAAEFVSALNKTALKDKKAGSRPKPHRAKTKSDQSR